nr:MAG TPA: hypothetical protein [Caudoviricetes sp.]
MVCSSYVIFIFSKNVYIWVVILGEDDFSFIGCYRNKDNINI